MSQAKQKCSEYANCSISWLLAFWPVSYRPQGAYTCARDVWQVFVNGFPKRLIQQTDCKFSSGQSDLELLDCLTSCLALSPSLQYKSLSLQDCPWPWISAIEDYDRLLGGMLQAQLWEQPSCFHTDTQPKHCCESSARWSATIIDETVSKYQSLGGGATFGSIPVNEWFWAGLSALLAQSWPSWSLLALQRLSRIWESRQLRLNRRRCHRGSETGVRP